jgi:hypothetical protein
MTIVTVKLDIDGTHQVKLIVSQWSKVVSDGIDLTHI